MARDSLSLLLVRRLALKELGHIAANRDYGDQLLSFLKTLQPA